jgi:hypothetical protein
MAVPSSGSLSLFGIANEKNVGDYTDDDTESQDYGGISLRGVSNNSFDDFGTGNIDINTDGWLSDDNTSGQTGANIASEPYSMSEFYGYDHDHVAEVTLHSTSFQPEKFTHQFPYQSLYHFSGVVGQYGNYPSTTARGSFNSDGNFTLGGKTGVALGHFYNYNITNNTTTGTRIQLLFSCTSDTSFANSGWTKLEVYANSTGTGSPILTLNRADAQFTASGASGTHNRKAKYEWPSSGHNASRAFSTFFGTDTTASNNTTHFIKIIN